MGIYFEFPMLVIFKRVSNIGKSNTKVGLLLDVPTWDKALPMLVNLKIVQHCREHYQGWLFLKIIAQHWKVHYQGWIFS